MKFWPGACALVLVAAIAGLAQAQSADERAAARTVVKQKGDAVVMVLATLRLRLNVGGQERVSDQAAQTNATILDSSGLAVLSLSALQPDDVLSRTYSRQVAPGTHVDVTTEPSDIRMHLADGRELPAKLILRDEDLDLAFIRPTEVPGSPLVSVDTATARPAIMDLLTIVQRSSETTAWATAGSFAEVQLVLDKPRTYYQVTGAALGSGLGSPLFDMSGRFVGVMVMRNTGTKGSSTPGVLPADDIREVARQAPPVK